MPTPQKLAISISDSQLDLETEIDPDWERLIGSPRFEAGREAARRLTVPAPERRAREQLERFRAIVTSDRSMRKRFHFNTSVTLRNI